MTDQFAELDLYPSPSAGNHTRQIADQSPGSKGHILATVEDARLATLFCAAPDMLHALHRAAPWMCRLIAEGAHLNTVAPNDAINTMKLIHAAIDKETNAPHGIQHPP